MFVLTLLPFVFFAVWVLYQCRKIPKHCPVCQAPTSLITSPFRKTERQWTQGGYVCPECTCELDMNGEIVAKESVAADRAFVGGFLFKCFGFILVGALPSAGIFLYVVFR
ncbi:hypothetical protein SAMN06265222_11897 [Neorhodopirellula lusitana]|uniref:LITAF domain-containing protein n=1 Tax=Neorhodopirellula lusitana TaxID=445327 RepID=A0ABY1QLQ6_9BACT|nr:hypothetical protein [Neorhodopirellula lusitana]SMP74968.1 hypothetical protein SAMN06265222_11897 [Neorhodopirellula lusitana]